MGRIKDAFSIQQYSPRGQESQGMLASDNDQTAAHLVVTTGGRAHEPLSSRAQIIHAAQAAAANRNLPEITHADASQIAGWQLLTPAARELVRQHRENTIGVDLSPTDLRNPEVQDALRWIQQSQRRGEVPDRGRGRRSGFGGFMSRLGSFGGGVIRILFPMPEGYGDYDAFYN